MSGDRGQGQPMQARPERPRAFAALFLSVLCPGLGHFAVGRFWPRGLLLAAVPAALTILQATAAAFDRPSSTVALFAGGLAARLAVGVDALCVRRQSPLPAWSTVGFVATGLVLFLYCVNGVRQAYLVDALHVPSGSMYPTVIRGDHVYVSRLASRPRRGDIVAFRAPNDGQVYLKRVIAIEHDRIEFKADIPVLDARPLPRRRLEDECAEKQPCSLWEEELDGRVYRVAVSTDDHLRLPMDPLVVPSGHVFVAGDSRDWSVDSRYFGSVASNDVLGTATFVFWSSSERGIRWDRLLGHVGPSRRPDR